MTVFSTASLMSISVQNFCTALRSLFIPLLLVLDIRTRSLAKKSADIVMPLNCTPSFVECKTLPSPETYSENINGDRTHPYFTPLVNHSGFEYPLHNLTLTLSLKYIDCMIYFTFPPNPRESSFRYSSSWFTEFLCKS